MNQESQEKLAVSKSVVDQLNAMVQNNAETLTFGQSPDTTPGPPPTPAQSASDSE